VGARGGAFMLATVGGKGGAGGAEYMTGGDPICIAGTGMTAFGRHEDRDLGDLFVEAIEAALAHAKTEPGSIGMIVAANSMAGLLQDQESVRGQVMLSGTAFEGVPLVNVENACASSSTALQVATWALLAGNADAVLVAGVEKLFHPDKSLTFRALASASDVHPERATGSFFMDFYASRARHHMQEYGTTVEQLAAVSSKNRRHGALNPLAQFRQPVSAKDVLASRMIADPLTLLMCSPISDGAAAAVLTRRSRMPSDVPAVAIRGLGLASGNVTGPEFNTIRKTAWQAYDQAGIEPTDVDLAEVHDATAVAEIEACEALGFCERGAGGGLAESGATALGGRLPVNASGGLCSRGHPVAATGLAQICELTWQLRGECEARQVQNAVVGIAENHGGLVGNDVAVAVVSILERVQ
jgi:acetyl-CoA acetyltransferase